MSALPTYNDCARLAASKLFPTQINAAGFTLRALKASAAALVGTQFHNIAAEILRARQSGVTDFAELVEIGMSKAEKVDFAQPTEWDDPTSPQAAMVAIEKITRAWLPTGMTINARLIEAELTKPAEAGLTLSGHIDVLTTEGVIRDHKTGKQRPSPQAQLGGYAILAEHAGHEVTGVATDWIKRVGEAKAQVMPISESFNLKECKSAAERTIDQILSDLDAFQYSGNPWEFQANPASNLCGQKYCPAFGTSFCTMGRE